MAATFDPTVVRRDFPPERDGIRVSFGLFNTIEDVDRFIGVFRRQR